jgi:hypothetical protein
MLIGIVRLSVAYRHVCCTFYELGLIVPHRVSMSELRDGCCETSGAEIVSSYRRKTLGTGEKMQTLSHRDGVAFEVNLSRMGEIGNFCNLHLRWENM